MANTPAKNRPADTVTHEASKTAGAAAETAHNAASDTAAAVKDMASAAGQAAKDMSEAAFAYPKFEVPEMFRSFAEQGLTQSRESFGRIKAAAEEATDLIEDSLDTTRASLRDVQFKAIDAAKDSADATFEFARKLLSASSIADAVQLQASFVRERFEAAVEYSKDMQSTLGKAGAEASKPAKLMMEKAFSSSRAA